MTRALCYPAPGMKKDEALRILDPHLQRLRALPYPELALLVNHSETTEELGPSGASYQVEWQVFWDDNRKSNLRVIVAIDNKGWRAFVPLTRDFIKAPDGRFV